MLKIKRQRNQDLWTSELENRLIEMVRAQCTLEEIARELSLPCDEIEAHTEVLGLANDLPESFH